MKALLSAAFGLHLLLGNLVLGGGIAAITPPREAALPPSAQVRLTPVTSAEANMSVAMTSESIAVTLEEGSDLACGERGNEAVAFGAIPCPTENCVNAVGDRAEPESTLLVVRAPEPPDAFVTNHLAYADGYLNTPLTQPGTAVLGDDMVALLSSIMLRV